MPVLLVPAKMFIPLMANEKTSIFFNPALTAVQFEPLLVERKTPPKVPAKILFPPVPLGAELMN